MNWLPDRARGSTWLVAKLDSRWRRVPCPSRTWDRPPVFPCCGQILGPSHGDPSRAKGYYRVLIHLAGNCAPLKLVLTRI
jgi:hypothetical protein